MKVNNAILCFLSICLISCAQGQTQPNLMGLGDDVVFRYKGGDTSLTQTAQSAYCVSHNATMVEGPNGKLYGLGVSSTTGSMVEYDYSTNTVNNLPYFNSTLGENPDGALVMASNGKLYGLTLQGGSNAGGTLFSYVIGDAAVTKLVDLPANATPYGSLIQAADGNLYGMTFSDGVDSGGTIFSYNIASGAYTVLYSFVNHSYPRGSLLEVGADTLYGMTLGNLGPNQGVLFRYIVTTHTYTALLSNRLGSYGSLMKASDGNLYGMAEIGGQGALFRYNISVGTCDTLHLFGSGAYAPQTWADLFQASDGMLYGFAYGGGTLGQGIIFRYDIASSAYTLMVNLPVTAAYYGHLMEYKIMPVRRHPVNASMCAGQPYASFIAADTSATATAQWQVSIDSGTTYSNISGASDTLYRFIPSANQNGNLFRALFTHNGVTDTSLSAKLTVWPIDTTIIDTSVCYGQSVIIYASQFNTSGTHIVTLPNFGLHGCDSVVQLNLTVYPKASDTITASICQGQSYVIGSNAYDSAGSYTVTFAGQSAHGCDSTRTLILNVYPLPTATITQAICPGSGYTLGTNTYTTSGIYTDTLIGATQYGCDSIVTLNLYVLDTTTAYFYLQPSDSAHVWFIINQSFGAGLSYTWYWGDSTSSTGDTASHIYASAGYYNICVTVTDSAGCSANYCDTSVYLFKNQSGQMVYVQVLPQYPAGINTITTQSIRLNFYSGAIHFSENIPSPASIKLYDLTGREIMKQNDFHGNIWEIDEGVAAGVYIVQLQSGSYNTSQKIMVLK